MIESLEWISHDADLEEIKSHELLADGPEGKYYNLSTSSKNYILKWAQKTENAFLQWEYQGARALYGFRLPKIPLPIRYGMKNHEGYVLFEGLPLSNEKPRPELVAEAFTLLHRTRTPWGFGFNYPTNTSESKNINKWSRKWGPFFFERRLIPLLNKSDERLKEYLTWIIQNYQELLLEFEKEEIKPALLHGNPRPEYTLSSLGGEVCVLAPQCTYGHDQFEVENLLSRGILDSDSHEYYKKLRPNYVPDHFLSKLYCFYFALQSKGSALECERHFQELKDSRN